MNSQKIWNLAGITVIIGTLLLTIFLGVIPTFSGMMAMDAERVTVEQGNAVRAQLLEQYRAASAHADTVASELVRLQRGVPASVELAEFLDEITVLSEQSGVRVAAFSASNPVEYIPPATFAGDESFAADLNLITPNSLFVTNVTMSVTGSFEQVTAFGAGLRSGSRVSLVYSFVIPDDVSDSGGAVTADITSQIFTHLH